MKGWEINKDRPCPPAIAHNKIMFPHPGTRFQKRLNDILEREYRLKKMWETRKTSLWPQAPGCQADFWACCSKAWEFRTVSEKSPIKQFWYLPYHILDRYFCLPKCAMVPIFDSQDVPCDSFSPPQGPPQILWTLWFLSLSWVFFWAPEYWTEFRL